MASPAHQEGARAGTRYEEAKGEPSYRFYLPYDKMYREDILARAYALAKSNQDPPGVDGKSF